MSVKICIAEKTKDISLIYNSKDLIGDLICLPLNLEPYLYCIDKKIKFIDPINFIDNQFHKTILVEGENFVDSIIFDGKVSKTLALEIKSILRHRFYSVLFISELFKNIRKKYKIESIVIPKSNLKSHGYHSPIIDDITSNLFSESSIERMGNPAESNDETHSYAYKIEMKTKNNKKNILFNSIGYNFKRVIYSKIFSFKYNFYTFNDGQEKNISLIKRIILKLLRINIINFKKINHNSENITFIKNINYKFSDPKIKKTISLLTNKLENFFLDFYKKGNAIDDFLRNNSFSLILVSNVKNIGGFITENYKKIACPTVSISHGIVSEKNSTYDEIYKKIIASAVFTSNSEYFAIQSKIAENSLNTHKFNGKKIITGNILFSENCNPKSTKKPKQILFAVTLKQFTNLQFLGVEMYYEFVKNLHLLNKLSLEKNIKTIVKIHPTEAKCIIYLKNYFKNLIFTNDPIDKLFNKCFVTVSFSSSVIEDSLHNRVPVILFDQWNRYIQCKSKNNSEKKALYYVNTYEDLCKSIDKILSATEFDFEEFIYPTYSKENINKKIFPLIK